MLPGTDPKVFCGGGGGWVVLMVCKPILVISLDFDFDFAKYYITINYFLKIVHPSVYYVHYIKSFCFSTLIHLKQNFRSRRWGSLLPV
jgi:hypothetical protein